MGRNAGAGPARQAGWVCAYTPIELLAAAGLTPRRLLGGAAPAAADALLAPTLCPFVRSVLASALDDAPGGPARPAAVVFTNSCNAMIHLYGAWRARLAPEFSYLLSVPRHCHDAAVEFFAAAMRDLLDALAGHCGRRITPDDLLEAMASCATRRRELRAAYDGQAASPPAVAGGRLIAAARAAATLAPGEAAGVPRAAAPVAAPDTASGGGGRRRPRLLLTGSVFDAGLIEAVEAAGADIVVDDSCLAGRYAFLAADGGNDAKNDAESDDAGPPPGADRESLLRHLARVYLRRAPCPRMADSARRAEHVLALASRFQCHGALAVPLKFCDTALYDLPRLKAALAARGVPMLIYACEYGAPHGDEAWGQVATRVGAFVEMLRS